jgi:hypothetical protein
LELGRRTGPALIIILARKFTRFGEIASFAVRGSWSSPELISCQVYITLVECPNTAHYLFTSSAGSGLG